MTVVTLLLLPLLATSYGSPIDAIATGTMDDGYELFHTAHMSVTERLIACLQNETMVDVALVGDDGTPVPACRYILGSASAAMQPLLYGNFRSASDSSTVNIRGSNQKSLTALVEFCCSDNLNTTIWADAHPLEIVQDTVALAKLAHTYEIPKLQLHVRDFLQPLMVAYPPLACAVFNLACQEATPDVYDSALAIIQEQAYVALRCSSNTSTTSTTSSKAGHGSKIGTMICLSPEKLEVILADNNIEADELFLFQQLVGWRDANAAKYRNANSICQSLVRHLDLSMIDPNEIETTVMKSGFVDANMLVQALMAQAKNATIEGLAFASVRGPRGRKYAHILVEGAGDSDCNGTYVHVKNPDKMTVETPTTTTSTLSADGGRNNDGDGNLLFFIKKPSSSNNNDNNIDINNSNGSPFKAPLISGIDSTTKTFVLVQDKQEVWRICDSDKKILYEHHKKSQSDNDQSQKEEDNGCGFPRKGWTAVTGQLPAPECRKVTDAVSSNQSTSASTRTESKPSSAHSKISSAQSLEIDVPKASTGSTMYRKFEEKKVDEEFMVTPERNNNSKKENTERKSPSLLPNETTTPSNITNSAEQNCSPPRDKITSFASPTSVTAADRPSQSESIDEVLSRKIASKSKLKSRQRKSVQRKNSLVDDLPSDDTSALLVDDSSSFADPIVGSTIGLPEKKKKATALADLDEIMRNHCLEMFDETRDGKKSTNADVLDGVATAEEDKGISLSCILPKANGEPVAVSCTPQLPSKVDVTEMISQMTTKR